MSPTIPEAFFETANEHATSVALLHKQQGKYVPITFAGLAGRIKNMCAVLQELGIQKGDKVALLSENRPEWVVVDLAVMAIGAVVVPLHLTLSSEAMQVIFTHCQAKMLIVSNETLLDRVPFKKENTFLLEDLIQRTADKPFKKVVLNPHDICTIIYTSGTTGDPKGVALTHANILSNVAGVSEVVPVKKGDVFLSFLPLSHVLERTVGYYIPLLHGATIAYAEHVKKLAQNLQEVRPTILIAVPRIFEKFHDAIWDSVKKSFFKKKLFAWSLRQHKHTVLWHVADVLVFNNIRKKFGHRLRLTISGGATLNPNLVRFFSKIGITILEGYGLTETSPVVATNTAQVISFGTVGKPLAHTQVALSPEKEILVKGPGVFVGYYRNEAETATVFNEDGWFLTGDLGFFDAKGFLTIIGRKKDMFVLSGGKNIWPEPIENLLNNDKFISQSMVVGNNEKFVAALIVPDWQEVEHQKLSHAILQEFLQKRIDEKINPHLSEVEQVKKIIVLEKPFLQENGELTPTLKPRRHIIVRNYEKEIEELYA
jgi:long-chain acyl-CoA synthetase